jgi:hypothetical protein
MTRVPADEARKGYDTNNRTSAAVVKMRLHGNWSWPQIGCKLTDPCETRGLLTPASQAVDSPMCLIRVSTPVHVLADGHPRGSAAVVCGKPSRAR